MKVTIEKSFAVNGPSANAWSILTDIPKIAGCIPGAEIGAETAPGCYEGKVKAKIGPAVMVFNGTVTIDNIDEQQREIRITGKGQDSKGTSSAEMKLRAWLSESEPERCQLQGEAEVSVTGKVASLGGRMLTQVAGQILDQFGTRFDATVVAMGAGAAAAAAQETLAEAPKELNGLAFAWSVITGFVRSLFGSKAKA